MTKLRVGTDVAYVLPENEGFKHAGAVRPAKVTRVWSPTCVNLMVFLDIGDERKGPEELELPLLLKPSVALEPSGCAPGTWHRFLEESEPANADLVNRWPSEPWADGDPRRYIRADAKIPEFEEERRQLVEIAPASEPAAPVEVFSGWHEPVPEENGHPVPLSSGSGSGVPGCEEPPYGM